MLTSNGAETSYALRSAFGTKQQLDLRNLIVCSLSIVPLKNTLNKRSMLKFSY